MTSGVVIGCPQVERARCDPGGEEHRDAGNGDPRGRGKEQGMNRRAFLSALRGSLIAAPLAARAQRPDRIRRIGILLFSQEDLAVIAPCFQELKALGYVDGKTVALDYRDAEGKYERLPVLAAELVRLGPGRALLVRRRPGPDRQASNGVDSDRRDREQ